MYILPLTADNEAALHQAAEILTLAFREHWPDSWTTLDEALQEVHEMLAPDRICRAACDADGNVLGWIGGIPEYDGNVWELHPLAVHPAHQRRGLGRALVADFEAQVRSRGGLTIMLGSDDVDAMTTLAGVDLYDNLWERLANVRNLKGHPYEFYQKLGYTLIGVMPDANGRGKPDIYMGKQV
jgi:aminoglycoside 6'-N-acetyltransferase I